MTHKKPTPAGAASIEQAHSATDRRTVAKTTSGSVAICPGCERFELAFGTIELSLSASRILELHRLVAAQARRANVTTIRIRVAHATALTLSQASCTELERLLAASRDEAVARLPAAAAASRWVH